jgi:hypothetical protein
VRVNQGGEPGHDDYGLPSIDIQVPDDARDLYRDVQAYHRELRALRRQERSKRWREPLRKSGLVLPVIAGFLVLAMIAGMILTMFSANPSLTGLAGQLDGPRFKPHASSTPSGSANASGSAGATAPAEADRVARLPAKRIKVLARRPFTLQAPTAVAIAVMPPKCRCSAEITQLLTRARSAGVRVYFDGSWTSRIAALSRLSPTAYDRTAVRAIDAHNALARAYRSHRLEILLVDSRGAVTVSSGFQHWYWTKRRLSELKQPR